MNKQQKIILFSIIVIMAIAFALRFYHFSDWLYFQGDQVRDATLATEAYHEGWGGLPLLGPRAGGTFTRLGPIFYYFQYISARIFGIGTPAVFAYPDLLFSILTLPLFYLFLRKFFKSGISLALIFLYSVSLYAIQYSRFGWNPNSLPFFNLLFFYSFLSIFEAKEGKRRLLWSALAGTSYAIASQLHFLSLVAIPLIAIIFLIFRRKYVWQLEKFKWWKYALVFLLVVVFFYIPAVFSEILTHGNNSWSFVATSMGKTSGGSLWGSLLKVFSKFTEYFLVIWTGIVDSDHWIRNIAGIVISAAVIAGILLVPQEKEDKKRNFLLVTLLWLGGYYVLYSFVDSKISARYFLPILPIPFLLLGFIFAAIRNKFRSQSAYLAMVGLIMVLALANLYSVSVWFQEIKNSELSASHPRSSDLKKAVEADTWWHFKNTASFMKNDCQAGQIFMFPLQKKDTGMFEYALEQVGQAKNFTVWWETAPVSKDACYFAIRSTKNVSKDFVSGNFSQDKITSFGDFSVVRMSLVNAGLKEGQIVKNPYRDKGDNDKISNISQNSASDAENQEADSSDAIDAANPATGVTIGSNGELIVPRMNRLFWRDVFNYFK